MKSWCHFCVCISAAVYVVLAGPHAFAEDWPMLGRDNTRNAVSPEKGAPTDWHIGEFDRKTGKWSLNKARNVKWAVRLGSQTIGDPVVADGLVWIGTNNHWGDKYDSKDDASVLACFRESDGKLLYRYVSSRLPQGRVNDWPTSSMACSPLVDGDRIWFVTNRGETVCLDIEPLKRGEGEPRVVWKLDMIGQLGVFPKGSHMALTRFCSVASYQDRLYVNTGNGVDETWANLPSPEAPSLICVDKDDGTVLWQDNSPGTNILSGQWASPLVIEMDGRAQVIAPQGDGWVRSFDALSGKLIWKFDMNLKTSQWFLGGRGTRNNILAPPVLYDGRIYVASGQTAEHGEGNGRLCCIDPTKTGDISSELAVDADGTSIPHRRLQAVDTDKGEQAIPNPNSGLIWDFAAADENGDGTIDFDEEFHRTLSGVAIQNDLLMAADFSGLVHCFDAKTGKRYWHYDALAAMYAQPLIVDGQVYIPDEDGEVAIFKLSADPQQAMKELEGGLHPINARLRNKELEAGLMPNSVNASPIFANGTLYIACRNALFAIQNAVDNDQKIGHWPQWRGPNRDNVSTETGLLQEWPAGGPPLVQEVKGVGEGIGSIAVDSGRIFILGYLGDSEYVTALDESTGRRLWIARIGPAVAEAATMRWLSQRTPTVDGGRLFAFTSLGELICLDTTDGKELWRKSYIQDFGAKTHRWGLCDYPLVDGERLICAPGGSDATVVAMNKTNGEVVWKSKFDATDDWSGINVCEVGGIRQYVMYLGKNLCGVAADDGRLLWRNEEVAMPRNYNTPIIHDDLVFCGTATGTGLGGVGLLQLSADGNAVKATQLYYHSRIPPSSFSDSAVLREGHVFLLCGRGNPTCLALKTGSVVWRQRTRDSGRGDGWVFADDHLYLRQTSGRVTLVEATPRSYIEKGSFVIPEHTPSHGATMPVVAGGHLYLRDNDRLLCYDVRAESTPIAESAPDRIDLPPPAFVVTDRPRTPRSVFVPTPDDVVKTMLELAAVKETDLVYDLGSGDGRIVIAAAKQFGCRAVGYEIDKELVQLSRAAATEAGVEELVSIQHQDIFAVDLSKANVIALYLVPKQLEALLPKLRSLKPGSRVVSHQFEIPGIQPDKTLEVESAVDGAKHKIHIWTTPLAVR